MKLKWMVLPVLGMVLLSACSSEPGMVTTESGLQYIDQVTGDGDEAIAGHIVSVHYTGWLQNVDSTDGIGTKFDSSFDRDAQFQFKLNANQVIPGWDEGITGMNVGGKRRMIIPSDLAYGENGIGPIPGGATLVFDVELFDVISPTEGLVVEDLVVGEGEEAVAGAVINAHYTGWLKDLEAENGLGDIFDSSVERGEPVDFPIGVGRVITGWDEGIPGMKVGGKRRLEIPPHLGYGAAGSGPIPPNSTLIFEVELLGITAPPPPPVPQNQE